MIHVKWTQLQKNRCPKHDLKKDNTNRHCIITENKLRSLQSYTENCKQPGKLRAGGIVFLKEEIHGLFIQYQRVNPEHIFIQVTYTVSGREARWYRKVWGEGKEKQIQYKLNTIRHTEGSERFCVLSFFIIFSISFLPPLFFFSL